MKMKSIGILSALLVASAARAQIQNAGFETGDLVPWSTLGNASVVSGSAFLGNFNGLITSRDSFNSQFDVEMFLGLQPGDLGFGYTNGSAIRQTFFAEAGQEIGFAYKFTAGDYQPFDDASFAAILNGQVVPLGSVSTVDSFRTTGWRVFRYTVTASGEQNLGFAVLNRFDDLNDSMLEIDSVPGPAAGLVFALSLLRRRRRKA